MALRPLKENNRDIKVTPEKLMYMIENWGEATTTELSRQLGVGKNVLYGWAVQLRKNGVKLARKSAPKGQSIFAQVAAEAKKKFSTV